MADMMLKIKDFMPLGSYAVKLQFLGQDQPRTRLHLINIVLSLFSPASGEDRRTKSKDSPKCGKSVSASRKPLRCRKRPPGLLWRIDRSLRRSAHAPDRFYGRLWRKKVLGIKEGGSSAAAAAAAAAEAKNRKQIWLTNIFGRFASQLGNVFQTLFEKLRENLESSWASEVQDVLFELKPSSFFFKFIYWANAACWQIQ